MSKVYCDQCRYWDHGYCTHERRNTGSSNSCDYGRY